MSKVREDEGSSSNIREEDGEEIVETTTSKGETGKSSRDMQSINAFVEERQTLDQNSLDKAVDKLLNVRAHDAKARSVNSHASVPITQENVKYFMERTGDNKTNAESFLKQNQNDLELSFTAWIKSPMGVDYDTLYHSHGKTIQ